MKKFIFRESEKAIMVKGKFQNDFIEKTTERTFWVPKSILNEKQEIPVWFIRNKAKEMMSGTRFVKLIQK